jgi:serine/threonine-protein kinase
VRGRIPGFFFSHRYKPVQLLGHGTDGAVYKAEDRILRTNVAIKLLPKRTARDKEAVEQITREAATAMRLSHDNIVRLHNVEVAGAQLFLVMEFVEGHNFREVLRQRGPLSLAGVLSVAEACASALDYAHARGVLHRDLKPENLMMTPEQNLKIVDFGTAMMLHATKPRDWVEGTPGYMSPEELRMEPLDVRADVYSLGVVLSELLTGRNPFPAVKDVFQLADVEPAPMPELPAPVAAVLMKAMARRPDDRWPSAGALVRALAQAIEESRG